MSSGKLAAQVAHGSMAFLSWLVRNNSRKRDDTKRNVYAESTPYMSLLKEANHDNSRRMADENGVLLYRRGDLYQWAKEAAAAGKDYFNCRPVDPNDPYGQLELCDPQPYYDVHFALDAATFDNWLSGSFTKVVLQVKSREKFFSVIEAARERGMIEGKDFFVIRDNCLTELTPEEEDVNSPTGGRTPTVIGFRPMEDNEIDPITKKLQLWRD